MGRGLKCISKAVVLNIIYNTFMILFQVNVQSYAGNTALHTASERSFKDIMTLLVQYGADTTIKNANHETYNTVAKDSKVKQSTDIHVNF